MTQLLLCFVFLFTLTLGGNASCQAAPHATIGEALAAMVHPGLSQGSEDIDPDAPTLVETSAEAIPAWRLANKGPSTLVLLSNNPFLAPLPAQLKDRIQQLARTGSFAEFKRQTSIQNPNPTMLPDMALSAALEAGLFSRIIWVLPIKDPEASMDLEAFRNQLVKFGIASQDEADSFSSNDSGFGGTLRGTRFDIARLEKLPAIEAPLVLHLSQSYFKERYQNEIRTPIYPLTRQILASLLKQIPTPDAVSIDYGNLNGEVPLQVRFLGRVIRDGIRHADRLQLPLSEYHSHRSQALYLSNFFQKEKVRDHYLAMEKTAPEDPAVQYDLYQVLRQFKQGGEALAHLKRAVELDPVYVLEYFDLADLAMEKKLPQKAIEMLHLARKTLRGNTFVDLRLAQIYMQIGHQAEAEQIFSQLRSLNWSPIYYPQIPELLKSQTKAAN